MPLILRILVLVSCVGLFGCGSSSGRVGVHGTVTYKNEPLKEGTIVFEPMAGADGSRPETSGGGMIKDGAYRVESEKGLAPGKYSVKISAPQTGGRGKDEAPGAFPLARELLPTRYNRETKLTAEITTQNPNKVDFPLD